MLDPRLLRAFVAIADAGSFTRAAGRLHMTQSTISQQLARLEEAVGRPLIDRAPRPVRATPAGERLLGYARRILALQQEAEALVHEPAGSAAIRLGVPEDIVSDALAAMFRDFIREHREIRLDVVTGLSGDLGRRYRQGELDLAIVKEDRPAPDCQVSFPELTAWFEGVEAPDPWPDPVPLVTFPPGALYREAMFERIEREHRRWCVAFSGSSFHDVLIGVEAGLGLSLLPVAAVRGRRVRRYRPFGAGSPLSISLYARDRAGPAGSLANGLEALLAQRLAAARAVAEGCASESSRS